MLKSVIVALFAFYVGIGVILAIESSEVDIAVFLLAFALGLVLLSVTALALGYFERHRRYGAHRVR